MNPVEQVVEAPEADIVERLRDDSNLFGLRAREDGATEIERLRSQLAEAREGIARHLDALDSLPSDVIRGGLPFVDKRDIRHAASHLRATLERIKPADPTGPR